MGHKSQSKLSSKIEKAAEKIHLGDIYYHYKSPDDFYLIEHIGFLENSDEVCIIYRALYGDEIVWIRPLSNFLEKVRNNKGKKVHRFSKVV